MKRAIVFFSLKGDCKLVAEKISEKVDGETDIFEIETVKPYKKEGFLMMLKGGFAAMTKHKPQIMAINFDPKEYDEIILGTPVWAGNIAPPLRTFFLNNYILDKKVYIYICSSSGNDKKTFDSLKESLDGCNVCSEYLSLVDPLTKPNDDNDEKINQFIKLFN